MNQTGAVTGEAGTLSVSLHRRLGTFQLAVDFQVPLGLIVLFGASGAGKTLTLRSLAGLLQPQQGHVSLDKHLLFDSAAGINLSPQERHVGYVPQHYALFPHLTVAENVRFALKNESRLHGWRKKRTIQQAKVKQLLTAFELEHLEHQYPSTLSGGQQQRVALARALAAEPRLLLLDEPFNALDASVREHLRDTLKQFQRRFAIPIVMVTHDHTEAQQLADTIVVLQQGRVAQVGSPQEIFFSPRTPSLARLVGQGNIFGASVASPDHTSLSTPSTALRLSWLQNDDAQQQTVPQAQESTDHCWLPLPISAPYLSSSPQAAQAIIGCIFADEICVHRLLENTTPLPIWTEQGAVLWKCILIDAQPTAHAVRLLVRPTWLTPPQDHNLYASSLLEVYLSRARWHQIEVTPGQPLLIEIPPQAVHVFVGA